MRDARGLPLPMEATRCSQLPFFGDFEASRRGGWTDRGRREEDSRAGSDRTPPASCLVLALAAGSPHPALAEQEPIDGDALLQCKGDQEIGVGGRAALVAVDVLLEHAQVSRKLALRAICSDLRQSLGKLSLRSFDGGRSHIEIVLVFGGVQEPLPMLFAMIASERMRQNVRSGCGPFTLAGDETNLRRLERAGS